MSEIAAQTGLVPSTAHRLLGTLVARGYAAQSPTTGRYLIGYKLLELTSGAAGPPRRACAPRPAPHLEAIQRETGETTNLVVLEGRDVVYVEAVSGTRSVRLFTEVGRAIPAHTSGAGKALLAWRDPADVAALLGGAPLAPSTPHTLTTLRALQEDLVRIRRRGYATDNEEHELGVACVATPVLDHARRCRSRRSASPARPRASCTRRRPTSRACCASTPKEVSAALGVRRVARAVASTAAPASRGRSRLLGRRGNDGDDAAAAAFA